MVIQITLAVEDVMETSRGGCHDNIGEAGVPAGGFKTVGHEGGEFIGFVSEFDILRALQAKKDLNQLTAENVLAKEHISVTRDTSIDEAVKIMEEKRLLSLPVKTHGKVAYSITRHDLLRAWIGLGMDIEANMSS